MISIEMIRERLKSVTYKSIDEFDADMRLLFSSWLKKNTEDHKYFKTFRSITERFKKQIDKAKQRLREIQRKAEARSRNSFPFESNDSQADFLCL